MILFMASGIFLSYWVMVLFEKFFNKDEMQHLVQMHKCNWVNDMARWLHRRLECFIDNWLKRWSSSMVDVKIKVEGRIDPIQVTVVVYRDSEDNTFCTCQFWIKTEFQYRCFKWSMCGLIHAYCKTIRQQQN